VKAPFGIGKAQLRQHWFDARVISVKKWRLESPHKYLNAPSAVGCPEFEALFQSFKLQQNKQSRSGLSISFICIGKNEAVSQRALLL
jgi:hypothetical protein